MKRKTLAICAALLVALSLTGCNYSSYDFIDTNYHFDTAYIKTPDGNTIEVEILYWADAEDGEQITVTATDGTRYLTNSTNVLLVEKGHK